MPECFIYYHFESLSLSKVAGTKIGRPVVRKSLDQVRRSLWKTCRNAATPGGKETEKMLHFPWSSTCSFKVQSFHGVFIYIYIFRHILGAVFSATHAAWLQKYHGRQVLNCWKLMGKQDLELNRWEMVKVDWVGECTIEFSKTCDGCTTCIWRGPYIQGMRQEAHVILYQQTTKIAGNIHGHAKMVVKIQKRRWLLAWCCAVQRCCATPRSFAWPSVKEIVLGCWDFGWGPGQRVYICIDYLCVVLYGVDRSSNIPCV